jgi:catechol 2,3-dioxygenase-like lactoylglutathione lyase family enzyme
MISRRESTSHKVSRREALGILGASASGAGALMTSKLSAAEPNPHFAALDHVGLTVADSQKTATFFARVFGNVVYKEAMNERRYVKLGPCYASMAPVNAAAAAKRPPPNYRVDHICPGIHAFDNAAVKRYLESQNVSFRPVEGFGPFVPDPDGLTIQLWTENSWSLSIKNSALESQPVTGEPIFQPTGIEHLLVQVTDPETSAKFYEKLFGPVTQRANNRIWFRAGRSRIGLSALPSGQRSGVNHFCVSAAAFDHDAVTKKLQQAGAKLEKPEVAGSPEFRDPNGILVQVMGPRG